jgi:hypothetical protein
LIGLVSLKNVDLIKKKNDAVCVQVKVKFSGELLAPTRLEVNLD